MAAQDKRIRVTIYKDGKCLLSAIALAIDLSQKNQIAITGDDGLPRIISGEDLVLVQEPYRG